MKQYLDALQQVLKLKRMSTGKIPKRGVFANIVIQEVV